MWIPTALNIKCVDDEGEVYRECIECGSMEIEMVENVESWRIAWDKRAGNCGIHSSVRIVKVRIGLVLLLLTFVGQLKEQRILR